jgi:hypothetical protein
MGLGGLLLMLLLAYLFRGQLPLLSDSDLESSRVGLPIPLPTPQGAPHDAKLVLFRDAIESEVRRDILEEGDIEEGLNAAAAIGDDRIQHMSGSRVQPEAFTHGSSEQRVSWFRRGLEGGDPRSCDTFDTQP